jgi:hypothetical protein
LSTDDANLEPFEADPPSLDTLLADVLGLVDEIVESRLAGGELARRRERIKAGVDEERGVTDRAREAARKAAERYHDAALEQAATVVAEARRQAERILSEARAQAEQIVTAAKDERARLLATAPAEAAAGKRGGSESTRSATAMRLHSVSAARAIGVAGGVVVSPVIEVAALGRDKAGHTADEYTTTGMLASIAAGAVAGTLIPGFGSAVGFLVGQGAGWMVRRRRKDAEAEGTQGGSDGPAGAGEEKLQVVAWTGEDYSSTEINTSAEITDTAERLEALLLSSLEGAADTK